MSDSAKNALPAPATLSLVAGVKDYFAWLFPPAAVPFLPARGAALARPSRQGTVKTEPRLPVVGSLAPDAISLGRIFNAGQVLNKMMFGEPLPVMIFGPNGTGKSTRLFLPNLLQMSASSIVTVDPKGELAAVSAPFRRTLGSVVILNPYGVLTDIPGYEDLRSHGFNPLARLDPADRSFPTQAGLIAEAVVTVGSEKDSQWDESALSMVHAATMYAVIEARRAGRVANFADVRRLICLPSAAAAPKYGIEAVGWPRLAAAMAECGIDALSNAAAQFENWTEEKDGIQSCAMRHTKAFDDPEIMDDLAEDGIDFSQLKTRPMTVYIILPPEMLQRHSKWLRLVLTSAITPLMRPRRAGEPKVLFMLDEFFALGHLPIMQAVWALVRGYGVQMMPVLQSLEQLQALYPKLWQTMRGMCGATASFTPNEMLTAEDMSKRSGDMTGISISYNKGGGTSSNQTGQSYSDNSGLNYSSIKLPRYTAHELFGMKPGFLQVTLAGVSDTIDAYAPPYYDIQECKLRARVNPYAPAQAIIGQSSTV